MKKVLLILMTLSVLISFTSCNNVNKEESITELITNTSQKTITDSEKNTAEQKIADQLIDSFKNQDSSALKSIARDKIYVIRWFSSGNGSRGKDTLLSVKKSEIPSNLQFNVDNETPINFLNDFSKIVKEYTYYKDDSQKLDNNEIKSVNAYVDEITQICYANKINENSIITCKVSCFAAG